PTGTVLIRSNSGQLMLVSQQAIARAQSQSQNNTGARPSIPTSTPSVRICTVQNTGTHLVKKVVTPPLKTVSQATNSVASTDQRPAIVQPAAATNSVTTVTAVKPPGTGTPVKLPVTGPPAPSVSQKPISVKEEGTTVAQPNTSTEMLENVKKCKNFLATLIKLASSGPQAPEMGQNVKNLVQHLLEAKIEPEEFTKKLYVELKSSPQPYLVPFLKKSMLALRQLMPNAQSFIQQCIQQQATTQAAVSTCVSAAPTSSTVVTTSALAKTSVQPIKPVPASAVVTGSQNVKPVPSTLVTAAAASLQTVKPVVKPVPSTLVTAAAAASLQTVKPVTAPLHPANPVPTSAVATTSLQAVKPVFASAVATTTTTPLQPVKSVIGTPISIKITQPNSIVAQSVHAQQTVRVKQLKSMLALRQLMPNAQSFIQQCIQQQATTQAAVSTCVSAAPTSSTVVTTSALAKTSVQPIKPVPASAVVTGSQNVKPVPSTLVTAAAAASLQTVKPVTAPLHPANPVPTSAVATTSLQAVKPVFASAVATTTTTPLQPVKSVIGTPISIKITQPNSIVAQSVHAQQTVRVKQLVVQQPSGGIVKQVATLPQTATLTLQKPGEKRMPLNALIQTNQFPAGSFLKQITLPGNKILSLQASPVQKNKIKENGTTSFRDEDDINDVTSMAGVNLSEENACILATNSEVVGTLIRSCADEPFLSSEALQKKILDIGKRHDIMEPNSDVVNLISHATQERLRGLLEKLTVIAQHRMTTYKESNKYIISSDTRAQLRFLEKLDHMEKQRKDEEEREMLLRAAKSRSNKEDPEQLRLKQKAKESFTAALSLAIFVNPVSDQELGGLGGTQARPLLRVPAQGPVECGCLECLLEQLCDSYNSLGYFPMASSQHLLYPPHRTFLLVSDNAWTLQSSNNMRSHSELLALLAPSSLLVHHKLK
ncbi:Transcription initiation factor TFIID subunit 4B, partial [Chelonia mydas]